MNDFFRDLETQLRPQIDRILSHPLLRRLHHGQLTRRELQEFAQQYHVYSLFVPRFIAAVAANVPDDPTRSALAQNLWEEHGEGNLERSHRMLYGRFLLGLGITDEECSAIVPLPSTAAYVDRLYTLCRDGHFLEGLGVLGPGMEFYTSEEYAIILQGLERISWLRPDDLEFFRVHIGVDDEHYSGLTSSLDAWMGSDTNRRLVERGARASVNWELAFWDGLMAGILPEGAGQSSVRLSDVGASI